MDLHVQFQTTNRCSRRVAAVALAAGIGLLLPTFVYAYETDQITDRLVPLRDAALDADERVDELLIRALWRTNQQTQCKATVERTRRVLAEDIFKQTAFPTYVPERGEFAGLGYGAYAAWLETDPKVDRREHGAFDDIYHDLRPREALVLGTVGVCSTVRIANILMGTDKPDHFWAQGYDYYMVSKQGRQTDRAVQWGTASERGAYGLLTSGVFSYADLAANWDGYTFYTKLLTPESPLQRDTDGCVVLTKPFRWVDWINEAVDEVYNPPNYRPSVGEAVRAQLHENRSQTCAEYAVWGPEVNARRASVIAQSDEHVSSNAPPRVDEWKLDEMCSVPASDRQAGVIQP
jgi:hypothetical protein